MTTTAAPPATDDVQPNVYRVEILPGAPWKLRDGIMPDVTMGVRRPGPDLVEVALVPSLGLSWQKAETVPRPSKIKDLVLEHFDVSLGAFDTVEQDILGGRQMLLFTFHYPPSLMPPNAPAPRAPPKSPSNGGGR